MQLVDTIIKFFHHVANPHCTECRAEAERELEIDKEQESCKNCQVLRELLESERTNNNRLLEKLLPTKQEVQQQVNIPQAVKRFISPAIRMQQLEQASRVQAQENLKEIQVSKEVEELEKELGVAEEANG